jgi:hypothetical protein
MAFVARRLLADSVVLVFAAREPLTFFDGLRELVLDGLGDHDARALLDSVIPFASDRDVRERILAEAAGNPLALLELPGASHPSSSRVGSVCRLARSQRGSRTLFAVGWRRCRLTPASSCWLRRQSRWATRWSCSERRGRWASATRPPPPPGRPACSTSERGCGFGTHSCGRRPTVPRRWRNAAVSRCKC